MSRALVRAKRTVSGAAAENCQSRLEMCCAPDLSVIIETIHQVQQLKTTALRSTLKQQKASVFCFSQSAPILPQTFRKVLHLQGRIKDWSPSLPPPKKQLFLPPPDTASVLFSRIGILLRDKSSLDQLVTFYFQLSQGCVSGLEL